MPNWAAENVTTNDVFSTSMKRPFSVMRQCKGAKPWYPTSIAGYRRSESYSEGTIPLQTLRADIDWFCGSNTTYGKISVKVWLCKEKFSPP